jgi:hypothetical protein
MLPRCISILTIWKFPGVMLPRIRLSLWRAANAGHLQTDKGRQKMNRWLEHDLIAFAALIFGVAAVEFLAAAF